jgi:hypothetical protein
MYIIRDHEHDGGEEVLEDHPVRLCDFTLNLKEINEYYVITQDQTY